MIHVDNVTMKYPIPKRLSECFLYPLRKSQRRIAIRGVSLYVAEGACVGLLGPNGAGKTALLKLIGGLLYPTEGRVFVNGYETQKQNNSARQSVSYVLNEDRGFYWRLTGIQNLEFFAALDSLFGAKMRARISELLNLTGLNGAEDIPVSGYSSGMRQRLVCCHAIKFT